MIIVMRKQLYHEEMLARILSGFYRVDSLPGDGVMLEQRMIWQSVCQLVLTKVLFLT